MNIANRIALIYGASHLGAGAVSYARGRRGRELFIDAVLHGWVAGLALNVVGLLVLPAPVVPVFAAKTNEGSTGMGNTPEKAVALLKTVDSRVLFSDLKENGVKIAEIPENASIVMQDMT